MAIYSSSVRPVRSRNTSSSEPRRTSTDSGCTPSRGELLDLGLAVVGVDEHPVGERLDAASPAGSISAQRLVPVVVGVEAQLDDLAGRVPVDQLARRALGDDAAAVHDHEPVAELLGLVHVVRREHERHALALQLVEPLPHEVAGLRVEPGRRLVEQHELGPVDRARGRS